MSTVEEHFAILRAIRKQPTDWLTDRYHQSAAIFLAAHLDELEAAWRVAHPAESGVDSPSDEGASASALATDEPNLSHPDPLTVPETSRQVDGGGE